MQTECGLGSPRPGVTYTRESLVKGRSRRLSYVDLEGKTFAISDGPIRTVSLEHDWYEDLDDPQAVIQFLRKSPTFKADLFTFWQRYPYITPKHNYHVEWEDIAVLEVRSYEDWWRNTIKSRVRNLIRKSEKAGVVVREAAYDDDFVHGMTSIFNESPIRQGRRFWHYGKDFSTVKEQFSRYIYREHMIGAYLQDEMIGFMMLGDAGRFGVTGQIIGSLKHRDKAINNALIAKAVEICEKRGLASLIYLFWSDDSLSEFKRRCGFVKTRVPRYFIPLSGTGHLVMKCGIHRGTVRALPNWITQPLKRTRRAWNERGMSSRAHSE
jgi:hypothetical protein